eukprot:4406717-Amphidinium_carterae.1
MSQPLGSSDSSSRSLHGPLVVPLQQAKCNTINENMPSRFALHPVVMSHHIVVAGVLPRDIFDPPSHL